MTDELKQAVERLGTDLDKGNIPFPFNSHIRTVLDALSTARRDAFEQAAIHLEGRRTVFMRDASAVIRALADIPAPACVSPDGKSDNQTGLSVEGERQADTGQAVDGLAAKLNAHANSPVMHWEDWAQKAETLMREAADALAARPAPVDAERIITDEMVDAGLEHYSEGGCMGLSEHERREVVLGIILAALRKQEAGE